MVERIYKQSLTLLFKEMLFSFMLSFVRVVIFGTHKTKNTNLTQNNYIYFIFNLKI